MQQQQIATADNLLLALTEIRREKRRLEHQEEYVKRRINDLMNEHQTNTLRTPSTTATRSFRTRQSMSRAATPADVWNRYARTIRFSQLNLRPL